MSGKWRTGSAEFEIRGSFIEIGKGVGEEGKQGALAETGRGRRRVVWVWSCGGGSVGVVCIAGTGSRRWTRRLLDLYKQLGDRL
jgi:hypothetical protein